MVYLGRVVGVGTNENTAPFGVYAVSGRSDMSKARIAEIMVAEIMDEGVVMIGPYGELSEAQQKQRALIFYNAVKVDNDTGIAVISNGKQTDPIAEEPTPTDSPDDYALGIGLGLLKLGGAEPDKYRTPRIAGIVDMAGNAALGIVTAEGLVSAMSSIPADNGYVSTYKGNPQVPDEVVIPELVVPTGKLDMSGRTVQQFADNMYDWMDRNFVVCTVAALWDMEDAIWRLAVRNAHE